MKKVIFIGGTDPSGGAGLQADLRSASNLGVWGLSVVTSVVAQNTSRVLQCSHVSGDVLRRQLDAIEEDLTFDAIKVGMLGSLENLAIVSEFTKTHETIPVVLDPIYFDGSGKTRLSDDSLFQAMLETLGKQTTIITPNSNEAFAAMGLKEAIGGWTSIDIESVMEKIHAFGPDVLLKSGHLLGEEASQDISDFWYDDKGLASLKPHPRKDINPRGTGCHLASAIAIGLAQGKSNRDAVEDGRAWLADKFANQLQKIGKGRRLIR